MLTPAVTVARHQLGAARDPLGGRFQCLRCSHEFKPEEARLGLASEEGWRPLFQTTGATLPLISLPPAISAKTALREGDPPQGRKTSFLPGVKIKPSACYWGKKKKKKLYLFSSPL